jgi:AcrR family transcriptional regulator
MQSHPAQPDEESSTREALLLAAGKIFAERGFRDSTIREICQAAKANIAAVNYHFGDKEHLYLEVLRYAHQCARRKFPLTKIDHRLTPEERLRLFVENLLQRLSQQGPHAWSARLMSREMIEATGALEVIVNEEIRPNSEELGRIIKDIVGPGVSPETQRLCAMSVVSQCVFYHHCRPVVGILFPRMELTPKTAQPVAAHITRFSLAALKEFARESAG